MPRGYSDGRHIVTKDTKSTQGYLKTEIEFHNARNCRYKDYGSDTKQAYNSYGRLYHYQVYYHIRECQCTLRLSQREEKHFERQCKWKRVIDEITGKAVLYRRCFCTQME